MLFRGAINLFVEAIKIWWRIYLEDFFKMGGDDQIFEIYCSETFSSEPKKFT